MKNRKVIVDTQQVLSLVSRYVVTDVQWSVATKAQKYKIVQFSLITK